VSAADTAIDIEDLRARASAANINERSLLATDYLNLFNEAMMLLELVPDMPDCIEDLADWQPVSYEEHFRRSGFSGRELAIQAYHLSPPEYRRPFDATIARLGALIMATISGARVMAVRGDSGAVAQIVNYAMPSIRQLQETAGAIINGAIVRETPAGDTETAAGGENTLHQAEIDSLMND
jgi:hypothetical protein